jgi:hypothetical protein
VFSVIPRDTVEAGYRRAAVWDVDDEIETVDREMFEAGVVGRYCSVSDSLCRYRAKGDLPSSS